MATKPSFSDPGCYACNCYRETIEYRACEGFPRGRIHTFRSSDPKLKAPKWCPKRLPTPICRIYGFKDEKSEWLQQTLLMDSRPKPLSVSPHRYKLRKEMKISLSASKFYDACCTRPVIEVLPNAEIKFGEVICIDNGLTRYYFCCLGKGIEPLSSFFLTKEA